MDEKPSLQERTFERLVKSLDEIERERLYILNNRAQYEAVHHRNLITSYNEEAVKLARILVELVGTKEGLPPSVWDRIKED